jgi:hypothetical protein
MKHAANDQHGLMSPQQGGRPERPVASIDFSEV